MIITTNIALFPNIVTAAEAGTTAIIGGIGSVISPLGWAIGTWMTGGDIGGGGVLFSAIMWAFSNILYGVLIFIGWLLGIAGTFADWMIQPAYIINSTVVQIGWGVTRDLANMFFILILLGIALDYILFQSFGVKRALPMLVVVALLINFSLPIAGIFIDFANVFTDFFMAQVSGNCGVNQKCGFTVAIAQSMQLTKLFDQKSDLLVDMLFTAFLMLGTTFILLALGIMFLLRTGWLYALLILLPLVLVLMPFPKTSSYFGRWTSKFFQWTFFAPVAAFFLYLSMLVFIADLPNLDILGSGQLETIPDKWDQGAIGGFIQQVIKYIVVWFFMLGSLMAAQAMSITGAGAALGMIKSAQKWAGGKVKSAGKKVGGAAARRAEVDKKLDRAAEMANKIPLVGAFAARGLRGAAVKTEQAIKQQGMLTKDEREKYEKYNDERLMSEYKNMAESKLPYAQAKAAQIAEMLTRRGSFNVKKSDGTIDTDKTRDLAMQAYGFAKTHKNKDAMKYIRKSNPIAYQKIIEQEYEEAEKEGKVIRFADPKTGQEFRRHTETGKTLEEAQNKAFEEMTSADFENLKGQWDEDSVEKFFTSGAMTSGHLRAANIAGDHAFIDYVSKAMQNINNLGILKSKSPSFYNYLESGKGEDFGLFSIPKSVSDQLKGESSGYGYNKYKGEKREYYKKEATREGQEQFDRDAGLL